MMFEEYKAIRSSVIAAGFEDDINWSETVQPPTHADDFASEAIFVICNSGMKWKVAQGIYERVMHAIRNIQSAHIAFGHKGKATAIDTIWRDREQFFASFQAANDKVAFCETLPWIGPITKYHLAKNFGVNCAKPDRHLQRVADRADKSVEDLCADLAEASGDRIATVDYVIWRGAERGFL